MARELTWMEKTEAMLLDVRQKEKQSIKRAKQAKGDAEYWKKTVEKLEEKLNKA